MIKSGIYCIENIVNKKKYVGSTKNVSNRKNTHFRKLRKGIHENSHLQNSFNKYGEEKFIFYILEEVYDVEALLEFEQYWFDEIQPEYNQAPIAGTTRGIKLGPISEYQRECIIQSNKNRIISDETRQKMRESARGHGLHNTRTLEWRKNQSNKISKSIIQINNETDEIIKIWESAKKAGGCLRIDKSQITKVCRGKQQTAGGYKWIYANVS